MTLIPAFKLTFPASSGPSPLYSIISGSTDGMSALQWSLPVGVDEQARRVAQWAATGWHDFNHMADAGGTGSGILNLLAVAETKWKSGTTARGVIGAATAPPDIRGGVFRIAIRPKNLYLPRRGQLALWVQTIDKRANLGLGANVNAVQLMNPICEQLGFLDPYERPEAGQTVDAAEPIWCEVPLTTDDLDWQMLGARASRVADPSLAPGKDYGVSLCIDHTLRRLTTNLGMVMFYPGTTPPPIGERLQGQFHVHGMELLVDPALNPALA